MYDILILYLMEKFDQKSEEIKNVDLTFFFFFLSSFIGFTHSFHFLLTCSNIGENQIIHIKNFKFINIFFNDNQSKKSLIKKWSIEFSPHYYNQCL